MSDNNLTNQIKSLLSLSEAVDTPITIKKSDLKRWLQLSIDKDIECEAMGNQISLLSNRNYSLNCTIERLEATIKDIKSENNSDTVSSTTVGAGEKIPVDYVTGIPLALFPLLKELCERLEAAQQKLGTNGGLQDMFLHSIVVNQITHRLFNINVTKFVNWIYFVYDNIIYANSSGGKETVWSIKNAQIGLHTSSLVNESMNVDAEELLPVYEIKFSRSLSGTPTLSLFIEALSRIENNDLQALAGSMTLSQYLAREQGFELMITPAKSPFTQQSTPVVNFQERFEENAKRLIKSTTKQILFPDDKKDTPDWLAYDDMLPF